MQINIFENLNIDDMDKFLQKCKIIRDKKLYLSRNYVRKNTKEISITIDYIWAIDFKMYVNKYKIFLREKRQKISEIKKICLTKYSEYPIKYLTIIPKYYDLKNVYRSPKRGDLKFLCEKYGIHLTDFQRGEIWIFLKNIIIEWYREHYKFRWLQLELIEYSCLQGNYINKYKTVNLPGDGFSTSNTPFSIFLQTLGNVCKTWRVVLKSMCVWWGTIRKNLHFVKVLSILRSSKIVMVSFYH